MPSEGVPHGTIVVSAGPAFYYPPPNTPAPPLWSYQLEHGYQEIDFFEGRFEETKRITSGWWRAETRKLTS